MRTGLGADWSTLKTMRGKNKQRVIQLLCQSTAQQPPACPKMTRWQQLNQLNQSGYAGQKKARAIARQEGIKLKLWWIQHMLKTTTPLVERMTLFWHDHFTSSIQKVLQPQLLHQQNQTLRTHALGSFEAMLRAMFRDPAMLIYLDGGN